MYLERSMELSNFTRLVDQVLFANILYILNHPADLNLSCSCSLSL